MNYLHDPVNINLIFIYLTKYINLIYKHANIILIGIQYFNDRYDFGGPMSQLPTHDQPGLSETEQAIQLALKGLRFGSVEIVVHDSKVVQIERKEKTRLDGTVSSTNR